MANLEQFNNIRPYTNEEVPEIIKKIVWEKGFMTFVKTFFPEKSIKNIITNLLQIKTIEEFQTELIYPIVQRIIKYSISELTIDGLENLDKSERYIFISNHRDIILDSALLEYILHSNNFPLTEIAIGSNLLILDWIIDLVRLNRSFIVKRDIPRIELYKYSVQLSKYIRFLLTEQNQSIWIAQREGRTKNGDDKTQVSLLKMLNLSGENDFIDNFEKLNIVPISISYEIESCIVSKIQDLYNKQLDPTYKKTKLNDLSNMSGGLEKNKGHIYYTFGTPINKLLGKISHITNRKEQFAALKDLIDNQIHRNYKLTSNNYIAANLFFETDRYSDKYTTVDKERFEKHLSESMELLEGDKSILKRMFLEIYAMPVKNYEEAIKKH